MRRVLTCAVSGGSNYDPGFCDDAAHVTASHNICAVKQRGFEVSLLSHVLCDVATLGAFMITRHCVRMYCGVNLPRRTFLGLSIAFFYDNDRVEGNGALRRSEGRCRLVHVGILLLIRYADSQKAHEGARLFDRYVRSTAQH